MLPTYTGKYLNPLTLTPSDIDLADIAHHLSNKCRWGGATRHFYSVAEHSVRCAMYLRSIKQIADPVLCLWALMHDAAEAYLGDFSREIKPSLSMHIDTINHRRVWAPILRVEADILRIIAARFYLPWPPPDVDLLRAADDNVLATERRDLITPTDIPWDCPGLPIAKMNLKIPWTSAQAGMEFQNFYYVFTEERAEALTPKQTCR